MPVWPPITGSISMTTGALKPLRSLTLLLGLLLALPSVAEWGPKALLASLAEAVQPELRFVEERHDELLGIPLRSEGRLEFRAPDYLAKTIERGGDGSFVIEGDSLQVTRRGELHQIPLDSHPALRALATALRASLGGDYAALAEQFALELRGEPAQWRLILVPHQREVRRLLESLELGGSDARLLRISAYERGGQRSVTTLIYPDGD